MKTNELVEQLMEITQLSEDQARLYLEIYGENLEVIGAFYLASNECCI